MEETEQDKCEHIWGPVEIARFTGNPHRRCTLCGFITLDLDDEEDDEDEEEE